MILAHNEIRAALESGTWTAHRDGKRITADELTINPNSANVSISNTALQPDAGIIDLHDENSVSWTQFCFSILEVFPGDFFLAHVRERFDCSAPLEIDGKQRYFAPMIEGRSTVARCGLSVHSDAGFGDFAFKASFVLEITSTLPVAIRPGDEIAQIAFVEVSSPTKYDSVYADQYDEPRAPVLGRERFRRFA